MVKIEFKVISFGEIKEVNMVRDTVIILNIICSTKNKKVTNDSKDKTT